MDEPSAAAVAGERGNAPTTPTDIAQALLSATKLGEDPDPHLNRLAAVDDDALERVRTDRQTALAFWCNLYNAGTQLLLDRRPELYESPLRFFRFFRATAVTVGGADLSLDTIENGILRASRSKYTMGYTRQLWPGSVARRYRLDAPDPRIHFALNCGAESCPAIRFYEPENVDDQLDMATELYLDSAVKYDPEAGGRSSGSTTRFPTTPRRSSGTTPGTGRSVAGSLLIKNRTAESNSVRTGVWSQKAPAS